MKKEKIAVQNYIKENFTSTYSETMNYSSNISTRRIKIRELFEFYSRELTKSHKGAHRNRCRRALNYILDTHQFFKENPSYPPAKAGQIMTQLQFEIDELFKPEEVHVWKDSNQGDR